MTPEVSVTVLKTFKGFVYLFTELLAITNKRTPQKSLILINESQLKSHRVIGPLLFITSRAVFRWEMGTKLIFNLK